MSEERRVAGQPSRVDGGTDTTVETMPARRAELVPDVENGDLGGTRSDRGRREATSDPDPDAIDAEFPGEPLTDQEIDELPVEES